MAPTLMRTSSRSIGQSQTIFSGLRRENTPLKVPYGEREDREEQFRTADLPVLYCSPTMELGVDISQLNVANMRNVPPTPANYAQRSEDELVVAVSQRWYVLLCGWPP